MRYQITIAALLLMLAGCTPASDPDVTPDSGTGAVEAVPQPLQEIGFITSFGEDADSDVRLIDIDMIEWYTGDDAVRAMEEDDPQCETRDTDGCTPPNDFYIRNTDKDSLPFEVSDSARFYMQTFSGALMQPDREVSYEEFLRAVRAPDGQVADRYKVAPFWFLQEDGVITEMREQYVP